MDRSRVAFLSTLLLLPFGGLLARLVQLQLISPHDYTGDLGSRRRSIELAGAPRGRIVDRHGLVLAEDRRAFDVHLVLEEYEKSAGPLAQVLGIPDEDLRRRIEEIYLKIERQVERRPAHERRKLYLRERRTPYLLVRDIEAEAALTIETGAALYAGAVVRESLKRHYPFRETGCHIVGYLGSVTANAAEFDRLFDSGYFTEGFDERIGEDGVARLKRRGALQEEMIGRAGVEKRYNDILRTRLGIQVLERVAGKAGEEPIEIQAPAPGQDVELTIDINLQKGADAVLTAQPHPAAAVVLDPRTGEVLLLASNRFFDPNHFIPPGNAEGVRRAFQDVAGKPMVSRAFANHYQLGSIFKGVTAAAALEEGRLTPEEMLPCNGRFLENSTFFRCLGTHGLLPLREAMGRSCNCFFYEAGRRCGVETVAHRARSMGYGEVTGLDLPGEARGRLPENARMRNDILSLAIGQHELMASPLQAAVMMAAISNGGLRVTPHVRRGTAKPPEPIGLSARTLDAIRQGFVDVVHAPYGTAHRTSLAAHKAAGKTSSAQAGESRDSHAWFAGYAPHDAPRYVVVVFVEHGGHGGETAAPLAAQILELLAPLK